MQDIERAPWHAILRPWSHVSLWRGYPPLADSDLANGLRYLGFEVNPFGSERAETDTLLLESRVDPPWLQDLRVPQPSLVIGSPGSGKTQISEALAHELSPYVHVATPAVEDQTAATGMPVKIETPDGADVAFIPFKMVKRLVKHDPDAPTFICILS